MSFSPGEEAETLRAVLREFLGKSCSESDVRRAMESEVGFDENLYLRLAREIGVQGLAVPPALGGQGATLVELGVAFEELGRALVPGPLLATVMAITALLESGDSDAQQRYVPSLVDGELHAAMVGVTPEPVAGRLRALSSGDDTWAITGAVDLVVGSTRADLLLVAADAEDGLSLFAVSTDSPGVEVTQLSPLDQTRPLIAVTLDQANGQVIGSVGAAGPVVQRTLDIATILLAAEQLGGAAAVLDQAVDYARNRVQFGRAIGSFQAIKHRCVDMLVDVESSRSVVQHGLWSAANEPDTLSGAASLARAVASDAYTRAASHNLQIHGGIGFTWEHSAHLHLKRAKSAQLLLGSSAQHRARLAGMLDVRGSQRSVDPGVLPPRTEASSDLHAVEGADPEEASLAAEVNDFLRRHPVAETPDRDLRAARFDEGLAVVAFEPGNGGRGLSSSLQSVVDRRFEEAGAADWFDRNVIGLGMALPTIHTHGSPEQRTRYLRPCFVGDEIWCQLFSEPGAGSDLANLATRAVREGQDYIVNGQKVWTSLGHVARFGLLLARTDPQAPKHKGLTYFIVDMESDGVEVRPLRQITGEAEFNEVYLTDVRIPASNILGVEGNGWSVAMTTLASERVSLGGRVAERGAGPIAQAMRVLSKASAEGRNDPLMIDRFMQLWVAAEAARLTNLRAAQNAQGTPGPEGSIAKLQMAELNQAIYEFCIDGIGYEGMLYGDYTETAPDFTSVHGDDDVRKAYLRSRANSIEGGTSEVLRNIVGERVLRLPGEPRVDRELPWSQTRRS